MLPDVSLVNWLFHVRNKNGFHCERYEKNLRGGNFLLILASANKVATQDAFLEPLSFAHQFDGILKTGEEQARQHGWLKQPT
jgi:hypothetical protein